MRVVTQKILWPKFMSVFVFLLVCSILSVSAIPPDVEKELQSRGEVYFRFPVSNQESLDLYARILSLDYYDPEQGLLYSYANKSSFKALMKKKAPDYELLTPPGLATEKNQVTMLPEVDVTNIDSWAFYPTYGAYESMMQQFEDEFPDLYQRVEIGTTPGGRKLIFGRITSQVYQENDRPVFMYTSTMHGDETTGFNLSLRLIHFLLNTYGENPIVTQLLDELEIWICPNENPDGTYTSDNSTVTGATRSNANYVDLNRNYPNPVYVPEPTTQPETQAMKILVQSIPFVMSANMHTGIECVNYPWDSWTSSDNPHADHHWWQLVMHEYADTARYYSPPGYMNPSGSSFNNGVTHGGDWYVVYGSRQDYMNYYAHQREFTLELSDTKILPTDLLPEHWDYNYRSLLNYMQQSLNGIRGKVTDKQTGEPIAATIEIIGHDKDNSYVYSSPLYGNFSRPILEGVYSLEISAEGYPSKTIEDVSVENHQATWLDIKLSQQPADIAMDELPSISVYPNPASQYLYVDGLEGYHFLEIMDASGRIVLTTTHNKEKAFLQLDVSQLEKGLYFLRFPSQENRVIRGFIKK